MVEREILSGVNSIDGNAVIQSLSERPGDPRFNCLPDLIDAVRKGIMENTTYGSAGGDSTVIVLAFVANLLEIDRNLDPRASRHLKKAVEALGVARLALGRKAKGEAACIALSRTESQILAVSDKLRRYLPAPRGRRKHSAFRMTVWIIAHLYERQTGQPPAVPSYNDDTGVYGGPFLEFAKPQLSKPPFIGLPYWPAYPSALDRAIARAIAEGNPIEG
jgi:hypothetical protein